MQPVERQRLAMAEDIGGKVRSLLIRRQVARDKAHEYRRKGQLVPASLGDEITDLGAELRWAVGRYDATRETESSPH